MSGVGGGALTPERLFWWASEDLAREAEADARARAENPVDTIRGLLTSPPVDTGVARPSWSSSAATPDDIIRDIVGLISEAT